MADEFKRWKSATSRSEITSRLVEFEKHLDARLDVRDAEVDKLHGELATIMGLLGDDSLWRQAILAVGSIHARIEALDRQTTANAAAHVETRKAIRWLFAGLILVLAFLLVVIGQHIYLIRQIGHLT